MNLNMDTYVQRLCQTAMGHLRNIADIRRCLSHDQSINQSNFYSANILAEAKLSGATAESVFNSKI